MSQADTSPDIHLDATALPASSVFFEPAFQPVFDRSQSRRRRVTFLVGYTPSASASAGRARFKLDWDYGTLPNGTVMRPVAEPVLDTSIVTPTVIAGRTYGLVSGHKLAWNGTTYDGTTLGAVTQWDEYTFEVPAAAVGVRLSVAEVGDTTNRGTVRILMSQSTEF